MSSLCLFNICRIACLAALDRHAECIKRVDDELSRLHVSQIEATEDDDDSSHKMGTALAITEHSEMQAAYKKNEISDLFVLRARLNSGLGNVRHKIPHFHVSIVLKIDCMADR